MFLFFYGENQFLMEKKLEQLKDKYRQKSGGNFNLINFNGSDFNVDDLLTQAMAVPLLATSRLVVVRNIFDCRSKNSLEKIKDFLSKVPETTIIVFTQIGNIDKRLGLYKTLVKSKNAHEFKALDVRGQKNYAKREIEKMGSSINEEALELLIDYCQGDLFALSHEIEKLTLYRHNSEITIQNIEEIATKNVSSDVFQMIDSLAQNNHRNALRELEKLLINKEAGLRILAMVNYQYRLIAQVKEAQEKASNPFQVSKIAGVSYFQTKKVYDTARQMSWKDLYNAYTKMEVFDEAIKTGKISEEEGIRELIITL